MLNTFNIVHNALQGKQGIEYVGRLKHTLRELAEDQQPTFPCPAVLIEFTDITYGTHHYNTQVGSGTVRLYIVQTEAAVTDEIFFSLRDTIHKTLQNIAATDEVGRFSRIAENIGTDVKGFSLWTMDYAVTWNDDSATDPFAQKNMTQISIETK